jgi:hypothetical protein
MSDFSQGTCAELGSMFLGVREKINAKKDKDRPRCSCRQCEPKGDTSMQVQGANPQSSKLQGAQCEPNMSLTCCCGLTGTSNINHLGKYPKDKGF